MINADNHRIQTFTPEGHFRAQLSIKGKQHGQSVEITIDDNNLIYVKEAILCFEDSGIHDISIFTTDGHFVRSIRRYGSSVGQFNAPFGMTFDKEGYLYVCDCLY